uniref:DUF4218 domain-containing protein n=1 Tax=Tanacetum cinerariifolium TaxID=118510 RepID=A0A699JRT2_TANCI|nr:hypothetical protein [Tanacetum cinerariifolium]
MLWTLTLGNVLTYDIKMLTLGDDSSHDCVIAEGYVAEEALTFSSHYFRDVTMKFNCPDRNVDFPPLTCQFQVFISVCKSISLRLVIRNDHPELKKVICLMLRALPVFVLAEPQATSNA